MRSPLSPILADIVQNLEEKAIKSMDIEFPFYYRYIDDIVVLALVDRVDNILNSFNNIYT